MRKVNSLNKAFKSDSQRLAVSLRSSIAKRRSHLNAALVPQRKQSIRREFLFLVEYTHNSDDIALNPVRDNHRNLRNDE